MAVQKGPQSRTQDETREEGGAIDPQAASHSRCAASGAPSGFRRRADEGHHLLVEASSLIGQSYRPGRAFEHSDAQPGLQSRDGAAHTGLRHVERFTGASEACRVDDRRHDVDTFEQLRADTCHETALASRDDAAALGTAFAAAEAIFVLLPPVFDPSEAYAETQAHVAALVAALQKAQPRRVVALSTIGAQAAEDNLLTQLQMMERAFAALTMPVAFLRPAWSMENAAWDIDDARSLGVVSSFLQSLDKPVPMVATADVAATAVQMLQDNWEGAVWSNSKGQCGSRHRCWLPHTGQGSWARCCGRGGAACDLGSAVPLAGYGQPVAPHPHAGRLQRRLDRVRGRRWRTAKGRDSTRGGIARSCRSAGRAWRVGGRSSVHTVRIGTPKAFSASIDWARSAARLTASGSTLITALHSAASACLW